MSGLARLRIQLRARWSAFVRDADATRRASAEISTLIKKRQVEDASAMAAVEHLEWPLRGRITSRFGMRHGRLHEGVDIALPAGSPVRAARGGTVLFAGDLDSYGNVVVLGHGSNLATVYGHLESIDVTSEQCVEAGERLGAVGTTGRSFGPHLHFEVRFDGTAVDPLVYVEEDGGDVDRRAPE